MSLKQILILLRSLIKVNRFSSDHRLPLRDKFYILDYLFVYFVLYFIHTKILIKRDLDSLILSDKGEYIKIRYKLSNWNTIFIMEGNGTSFLTNITENLLSYI